MKTKYTILEAKQVKAKWSTVRGFARWARRHIGDVQGTLYSGESFRIATTREEHNGRVYVHLIVYGSGDIKVTKADVNMINFHFNRAATRVTK